MSYTINPNAKNKWARNAENTMDLSLETDASSVYLDNGRTLEQELGEGSMVSNVATVDTSMSKVIDGTLDGAYESGVMYGRSLVNLITNATRQGVNMTSSYDDSTKTWNISSGASWGKLGFVIQGKPNTKYYFLCKDKHSSIEFYFRSGDSIHSNVATTVTKINDYSYTFVTYPETGTFMITFELPSNTANCYVTQPMIIEYQDGMENWDIPYFEGLCDSKMPILRNVGKNLLDESTLIVSNNDTIYIRKYGKFPCKPNTKYRFISSKGESACNWHYYKDGNDNPVYGEYSATTTTPSGCHYLHIHTGNSLSIDPTTIKTMVVEDGQDVTYEDHKTNILHTPETVTLRSLPNGVRDELNLKTGEYIKRIGEVVLDGVNIKPKGIVQDVSNDVTSYFDFDSKFVGAKNKSYALSDKFNYENYLYDDDRTRYTEGIRIGSGGWGSIRIFNSKLETADYNGFVKWLQSNPVTVQYELAEPITTIVEPSTMTPFAYQNGHVILESGYEGQSLLPTLEYSTVVNRAGQVESMAKVIQKQEKQLTMLEQMLIQNIINLDYNNTLLTLKNEMEEML